MGKTRSVSIGLGWPRLSTYISLQALIMHDLVDIVGGDTRLGSCRSDIENFSG